MTSESWRRGALILGFCAITAFLAVVSILSVSGMGNAPPWSGHWGFNRAPAPFGIVITGIDPAGPAAAAGLHAGDAVDLRDVPLQERYWLSQRALNGVTVALPIRRDGNLEHITVTPTPIATLGGGSWRQRWILSFSFYSVPLLVIWLTLFATIIASRGGHIHRARLLALALVTYGAHLCIGELRLWTTPWLWENVVSDLCGRLMLPVSAAFSVALASTFGLPLSPIRRIVQYASYALLLAAAGLDFFAGLGFITLSFDWNAPIFSAAYLYSLIYFLPILCIALAIAASPPTERQRSVWMLVPLGTLFVIGLFVEFSGPTLRSSYVFTNIVGDVRTLIFLLVPIALTYAVLNRRVLDIAFVLNRAAVFAGVSVVLVGTFVLVEWLLAGWLQNTSHTTNIAISAVLALSLGLSIRYVHARVEHVVDNIFFSQTTRRRASITCICPRGSLHHRTTAVDPANRKRARTAHGCLNRKGGLG